MLKYFISEKNIKIVVIIIKGKTIKLLLYNALFLNRQVIVAPIIKNDLIKISRVKGKYIISKHEENRWSEFPAKIIKYIKNKIPTIHFNIFPPR